MKLFKRKKIITRADNQPYLIRWTLFECRFFAIKLHKILLSDDACLHDHPWSFISIILKGGYVEHTEKEIETKLYHKLDTGEQIDMEAYEIKKSSKICHPGNILFRKANHKHRLEVHQPATTLVISFKKIRQWGFFTKFGWVPWYKYDQGSNQC